MLKWLFAPRIDIPPTEIHLSRENFDVQYLDLSIDWDGNEIVYRDKEYFFIPADRTTRKNLQKFITNNLSHAVKYCEDCTFTSMVSDCYSPRIYKGTTFALHIDYETGSVTVV